MYFFDSEIQTIGDGVIFKMKVNTDEFGTNPIMGCGCDMESALRDMLCQIGMLKAKCARKRAKK